MAQPTLQLGVAPHADNDVLKRLLPSGAKATRELTSWTNDGLHTLRRPGILEAQRGLMVDEGRGGVTWTEVGQRERRLRRNLTNISKKLSGPVRPARSSPGRSAAPPFWVMTAARRSDRRAPLYLPGTPKMTVSTPPAPLRDLLHTWTETPLPPLLDRALVHKQRAENVFLCRVDRVPGTEHQG